MPFPTLTLYLIVLDPLTLVVDLLCVYRLTRLIVKDSLLNEVRWWILRRWPSAMTEFPSSVVNPGSLNDVGQMTFGTLMGSGRRVFMGDNKDSDGDNLWLPEKTYKVTELIECVYCASIWVAFAVLGLRVWWDWWQYPALALALAGGVSLIFSKLDTE